MFRFWGELRAVIKEKDHGTVQGEGRNMTSLLLRPLKGKEFEALQGQAIG